MRVFMPSLEGCKDQRAIAAEIRLLLQKHDPRPRLHPPLAPVGFDLAGDDLASLGDVASEDVSMVVVQLLWREAL